MKLSEKLRDYYNEENSLWNLIGEAYTNKEVEDIGSGINLMAKSDNFVEGDMSTYFTLTGTSATLNGVAEDPEKGGVLRIYRISSDSTYAGIICDTNKQGLDLVIGKKYTLSCYVKRDSTATTSLWMALNGSGMAAGVQVASSTDLTTEWKRFSYTFTNTGSNTNPRIYQNGTARLLITEIKLEEGSRLTP